MTMLLIPGPQVTWRGFKESILESDYMNVKVVLKKKKLYFSPCNTGPLVLTNNN